MTEHDPTIDEAQTQTELDLRMGEDDFEYWVRRKTRRRDDDSLASARRKARRKCARDLNIAARTPLNLPVWTIGALNFPNSEYALHETLTAGELETFRVLATEYTGSIGELVQHVQFLHASRAAGEGVLQQA